MSEQSYVRKISRRILSRTKESVLAPAVYFNYSALTQKGKAKAIIERLQRDIADFYKNMKIAEEMYYRVIRNKKGVAGNGGPVLS